MNKKFQATWVSIVSGLILMAACSAPQTVVPSLEDTTKQTSTTNQSTTAPIDAPTTVEGVVVTDESTETSTITTSSETIESTTSAPTLPPTPAPVGQDEQEARASEWLAQQESQSSKKGGLIDWVNTNEVSTTPTHTPTPLATPTPPQQLSPELNEKIAQAFKEGMNPSEGIFTSVLPPEYESKRHFMTNTYPQSPEEMVSDVPVTAEVRKEIVALGEYLVGLPYVYAKENDKFSWWASEAGYSANYLELRLSKDDGTHTYVDEKDGTTKEIYAIGPDCASFIKAIMDYALGTRFPDYVPTIYDWFNNYYPEYKKDMNAPETWLPGDIIIFQDLDTSYRHIAIYMGNGQLVQSVGSKVQITNMLDWSFRFRGNLYIAGVYAPPGKIVPEEDAKVDVAPWKPAQPTPLPTWQPVGTATPTPEPFEEGGTPTPQPDAEDFVYDEPEEVQSP